jgi:hypothetical protein
VMGPLMRRQVIAGPVDRSSRLCHNGQYADVSRSGVPASPGWLRA